MGQGDRLGPSGCMIFQPIGHRRDPSTMIVIHKHVSRGSVFEFIGRGGMVIKEEKRLVSKFFIFFIFFLIVWK